MQLNQQQLDALERFRNSDGLSCSDITEPGVVETLMTLAHMASSLELQLATARKELEAIVCTLEPDKGVVLLSIEAPTHWDEVEKCHVYDFENFSPLGDALIKIHDLLSVGG